MPLWLTQADTRIALEEELRAAANLEIVHRAGRLEADAIASLGHLYLQNGLPDLAQERYEAALRKEPFLSPARALEIVELFLSQSDWTRAKTVSGWIEASPHYREAFSAERAEKPLLSRLTRARALLELETGDAAAGAKRVEEWLRREPMDGHALLLLARFREEANQRVEAALLLEQAARIPETAAAAHLAHGRLLVAEGNYEKALEHLDESQKLDPDESVSRYLEAVRELAGGPQG
jgi:tetratricopeptide (TPR) repeat protein